MKKSTLCAGILFLLIGGCTNQSANVRTTYSNPTLSTPSAAPRHLAPAPVPQPLPAPKTQQPQVTWSEKDWIPRGGIRRGLWKAVVVHHSANTIDTPQSMDNYHRNVKHWSKGLGYHFVIGNGVKTGDGQIYVGSRWQKQCEGAHCRTQSGTYFGTWRPKNYFNEHGIGICLVGNFENGRPTRKQLVSLERLITFLCSKTGISPYHVYGHGEVTHKTACPGKALQRQLSQVRASVAQTLSLNWNPEPDRNPFFLGIDDDVAARPEANDHSFLLVGHTPIEPVQIAYDRWSDPFEDIANLDLGSFRLTAW